jgi:hypothetical protein
MFGKKVMDYFLSSKKSSIMIGEYQIDLYNFMKSIHNKMKESGDYKSFDQTIPSDVLRLSFNIIKQILNLSNYESDLFDQLVDYILYGHIYHPATGTILRERGIPSGSYFTNIVDGLSNLIMVYYTANVLGVNIETVKVCGDDNLIITSKTFNTARFTALQNKVFGVENNFLPEHRGYPNGRHLGHFLGSS